MLRLLVLVASAATLAVSCAGLEAGTVPNKLIVKYSSPKLDPTQKAGFFTLPRTVAEAKQDGFTEAAVSRKDPDVTVHCPNQDHRVCVLFDKQGSVAGLQVSVARSELDSINAPGFHVASIPEMVQQTVLGVPVYSMITFFVSKDVLKTGRRMGADTPTAPEGVFHLRADKNGVETSRLHVTDEQSALAGGFFKQSCYSTMGQHYHLGLNTTSTCPGIRPFFLLFRPKAAQLIGYGHWMWGKPSISAQSRDWFEHPSVAIGKIIAPFQPTCMPDWLTQYGLFTMHVFFIERPWLTAC